MRLGLSQKEISCLIFIFDESYSGFITRDDYANSLSAYKAAVENSHHPFIQECAFKLAQLLHTDKVNLLKFYEEMESRVKGKPSRKAIELNLFEEQVKKNYGGRIGEREIVAAFNAIDL
jgi:Ca2+-binding EF-hand superfamily protein